MKSFLFFLLTFAAFSTLQAQVPSSPQLSDAVGEAQQRVWNIGANLNDAVLNLAYAKLDWQKTKLTETLAKAQQQGDSITVDKIQKKFVEIDHERDVAKQKHDLNAQVLIARRQNNQADVDSLLFQLKELQ